VVDLIRKPASEEAVAFHLQLAGADTKCRDLMLPTTYDAVGFSMVRGGHNKMDWYGLLPLDLKEVAYKSLGGEFAWSRRDALAVISLLEGNGYEISAVDVWIPTNPGPTPYIFDWAPCRAAVIGVHSAAEFVRSFEWRKSDAVKIELPPYFNIWAERPRAE
jgi:hypothetical protein